MATRTSGGERTYGQWCPVAAGLDILGDRWVLLILRELLMTDRRFTDLRSALPGLAPNLLTERLRALQAEGLVETVELPPPAARTVYRATAAGRGVAPVLAALARFGAEHLEGEPSPAFDAQRALHSLLAPWRRRVEVHLRIRLVLQRADNADGGDEKPNDSADLVLDGLRTMVTTPEGTADVTITTDAAALARARRHDSPGLDAEIAGTAANRRLALDVLRLHLSSR